MLWHHLKSNFSNLCNCIENFYYKVKTSMVIFWQSIAKCVLLYMYLEVFRNVVWGFYATNFVWWIFSVDAIFGLSFGGDNSMNAAEWEQLSLIFFWLLITILYFNILQTFLLINKFWISLEMSFDFCFMIYWYLTILL